MSTDSEIRTEILNKPVGGAPKQRTIRTSGNIRPSKTVQINKKFVFGPSSEHAAAIDKLLTERDGVIKDMINKSLSKNTQNPFSMMGGINPNLGPAIQHDMLGQMNDRRIVDINRTIKSNPVFTRMITGEDNRLGLYSNVDRNGNETIFGNFRLPAPDNDSMGPNTLNGYMDVQYHAYLSMISAEKARVYQTQTTLRTLDDLANDPEITVIASTGDVYRGSSGDNDLQLSKKGYYNIDSFDFEVLLAPSRENLLFNNIPGFTMVISEPVGMNLVEEIKSIANTYDYGDVGLGRYSFRLDIHFSGFRQDTGEWVREIPFTNSDNPVTSISYILNMSALQANIQPSGTTYSASMVPVAVSAIRPEEIVSYGGSHFTGETIGEFFNFLSERLVNEKYERTNHRLKRKYEFYGPPELFNSKINLPKDNSLLFQFLYDPTVDVNRVVGSGVGIDLETIIQGVLANSHEVQSLFISDAGIGSFLYPRIMWKIRTNIIYGTYSKELGDYDDMTLQYFIEPFMTYGGVSEPSENTIEHLTDPANQIQRLKNMASLSMLRRVYNYIGTSNNTEVINMNLEANNFYYSAMNTTNRSTSTGGHNDTRSAEKTRENASNIRAAFDGIIPIGEEDDDRAISSVVERLFGNGGSTNTKSDEGRRTGLQRLGVALGEAPSQRFYGDIASDPDGLRDDYERHLNDYLDDDFLVIKDLQIRGDPSWLLNQYGSADYNQNDGIEATSGSAISSTSPGFTRIRPSVQPVIYLRVYPPDHHDYMNPDRNTNSSSPNFIGGFYSVIGVHARFSGGTMTQSLVASKLSHLNYVEEALERG